MEDVDSIKAMDFLLHEFCISPSSEQFAFTDEPVVNLQHQHQEFSESYSNQSGSVLGLQPYFPVTNNTDEEDIPCYPSVDSFTPSVSNSRTGMAHISSRNTDNNAGHNLGFYTEVRRDESFSYSDWKDSVVSTERTTAIDVAMRDHMDLPDTTNSSPTHGPGEQSPGGVKTDQPSPSGRKRKATPSSAAKKLQFSRKRTRYTFSPAHLKLFESMFDVDQYPKRVHLVEMEKQFNIPEDKLRTWFQNRRAKEKRARLISTSKNSSSPETNAKEDSCDRHIDGKPVQLVSPHVVKTSSTMEMVPGESFGTSHSPGFVPRNSFQSNPYYSPPLFSCPRPCTPNRLTDVRTLNPPLLYPTPRNLESLPPRNVRKIAPAPPSPFSRVISPALSPSTGIRYTSFGPASDCPTKLPYPAPAYVQHLSLQPWTHDPQVLTPPSSPNLWQGGPGMSYPSLHPYMSMPIVSTMKDTNHRGRPTYNPIPKSDHIPSSPAIGHAYQSLYTCTGKSDFSSTQKPGVPGYHGNHSMVWHPQDSLQCKQNVFPYGCNYVGTPPMKVLPPSLYPWSYSVSPSYSSDINLLTGNGNLPQFDEEKQSYEPVSHRSPDKDHPE